MSPPDKVIAVCPACQAKLAVAATAVGKNIRCPKCQTVVAITAEMVSVKPQTPPDRQSAAPAEPPKAAEVSLGDENTFTGPAKKNAAPESLGDEFTYGGNHGTDDAFVDDDMEIVDLSARYTIEGVLGKGGMGEVQLATDNRLKRKVAIKRVLGDMAKSQTAVRRFMTEAQSIAALNHPNIVQIHDYGRDKNGPFLILEYVEGKSLLERCQRGAIPLEEAIDLTCQLCDGLGTAHDASIIHRDIKPANVLLTKTGIPKLTDFGLAKDEATDGGLSVAGAVLGTLDFMPPEQRKDVALTDSRSDLWSLAATLYQMVTGEPPRVIDLDAVPRQLRTTLSQALKTNKTDRYQTAREFKEALRSSLQHTSPEIADLGEGQCLHCGTKNEGHRKFCKECAVTLRVQCFSCSIEIPVWDKICSECGTRQAELLESRRKAMTGQQSQAESLLKNYDFGQATTLAVALRDEPDPRLQQLTGWSKQFLEEIASGRQQQLERIGKLLNEALQHEKAYDYPSGIHTLEQVPEILRSTSIPGQSLTAAMLLKRVNETQSEVHRLDELIRQRVKSRQLDGLLKTVEDRLALKPGDAKFEQLRDRLIQRDEKNESLIIAVVEKAEQQRGECQFAAASRALQRIPEELRTEEMLGLMADCDAMATQRKSAMVALRRSMGSEGHEEGLKASEVYRNAIKKAQLKDSEFETQYQACMAALDALRKAIADSERHRRLLFRLGTLAVTLVLVLVCGLIMRSSMRAKADRVAAWETSAFSGIRNSIGMTFNVIAGGTFMMGVHEVTQSQYEAVMGSNPSHFKGPDNPVETVSWDDAVAFCRKLSDLPPEKSAGRVYRLPTEAEWEYTCRAGTTTAYSFGDDAKDLGEYAWFVDNSGGTTHAVGEKLPNGWGLYDMHGNVFEWCLDVDGSFRVFRGGGWSNSAGFCRSAYRSLHVPSDRYDDLGFRLALSSPSDESPEAEQGK